MIVHEKEVIVINLDQCELPCAPNGSTLTRDVVKYKRDSMYFPSRMLKHETGVPLMQDTRLAPEAPVSADAYV